MISEEANILADRILLNCIPESLLCRHCERQTAVDEENIDMQRMVEIIAQALQAKDDELEQAVKDARKKALEEASVEAITWWEQKVAERDKSFVMADTRSGISLAIRSLKEKGE